MRKDMKFVVTEPAKRGSRDRTEKRRVRSKSKDKSKWDDAPKRSGGRKRLYGWEAKSKTETLNPIKKFLAARVGKLWDNVYSEFCASLSPGSVRDYIWYYVGREVRSCDCCGLPVAPSRHNRRFHSLYNEHLVDGKTGWCIVNSRYHNNFWIDDNGYLRAATGSRIKRTPERIPVLYRAGKVYGKVKAERMDTRGPNVGSLRSIYGDVWFEMETAALGEVQWDSPILRGSPLDVDEDDPRREMKLASLRTFTDNGPEDYYFGEVGDKWNAMAARGYLGQDLPKFRIVGPKRQISSRELRRLGLRNGASGA